MKIVKRIAAGIAATVLSTAILCSTTYAIFGTWKIGAAMIGIILSCLIAVFVVGLTAKLFKYAFDN